MVLAIAAEMDWEVRQLDVKTAFLCADIEEEVFVAEPPGFETNDKEKGLLVMKLGKSLYGLAQCPGNWFHTIDPVLISIGCAPLKSDTCIYSAIEGGLLSPLCAQSAQHGSHPDNAGNQKSNTNAVRSILRRRKVFSRF